MQSTSLWLKGGWLVGEEGLTAFFLTPQATHLSPSHPQIRQSLGETPNDLISPYSTPADEEETQKAAIIAYFSG